MTCSTLAAEAVSEFGICPSTKIIGEQLKSHVADLNVGGKWGGAITAAKFLEQFVAPLPGFTSISPVQAGPILKTQPGTLVVPAALSEPWWPIWRPWPTRRRLVVRRPDRSTASGHAETRDRLDRTGIQSFGYSRRGPSKISRTSFIGNRPLRAQRIMSRFSRPCFNCSIIGSISGDDWKALRKSPKSP